MNVIDQYAYMSRLNPLPPFLKCLTAAAAMAACLGFNRWLLSLFIIVSMGCITVLLGGVPWKTYIRLLLAPAVFLLLAVLPIVIDVTKTPANLLSVPFFSRYISLSRQSVYMGAALAAKAMGCVSCLYFLSLSTPVFEIVQVLERLRCPRLLTELMLLVYRFIMIMMDTCRSMSTAADARLGYMTRKTWMKTTAMIAGSLFLKSYKKSSAMYDAMEARCYDGRLEFLNEPKSVTAAHAAAAAGYTALLICIGAVLMVRG